MDAYVFRECEWDGCQFRFPVEADPAESVRCPNCGSATYVAAEAHEGPALEPSDIARELLLVGLLDNLRSIHNVGSIFRTADGAGVQHLYLAGITATPAHPKLNKAALGAQARVPWSHWPNAPLIAESLKEQGYMLVALETGSVAQPLFTVPHSEFAGPVTLVAGNERAGIDPGVLAHCDRVLSLPMGGMKRSLNVAVAFGIASYYLRFGLRSGSA